MSSVDPVTLREQLASGQELALLDVRERGVFSRGHIFQAVSLPLSWLELQLATLIPRPSTPIVVCDSGGDDDLAARAEARLRSLGYDHVAVLVGGVSAWAAAGYQLYSGVNVPSKAFGEFIEQTYQTPHLSAADLQQRQQQGERLVILDSRPLAEFQRMNIPGGLDCPGAELVHRVFDAAPDPNTLVVVNCAGRTRSIIGAQSLVNAGIPHRVAALQDGTMGWVLAGYELERGQERQAPPPSAAGREQAQAAAQRVAKRFGVQSVDFAQLETWLADRSRTLYLLDVRDPKEFEEGHLPGSRNAPGGQLVQATDEYVAVMNSRVVLVDDDSVRATLTASWLIQMGWPEVYVLAGGLHQGSLTLNMGQPEPRIPGFQAMTTLTPRELQKLLDPEEMAIVVDLDTSAAYRERHIPGARWTVRSRLPGLVKELAGQLVLTSRDGTLAHLAAGDIDDLRPDVLVLAGGNQAWFEAGIATESGIDRSLEPDDLWLKPYDKDRTRREQAMRDYLHWEVNLLQQLDQGGDAHFRRFD